MSTQSSTYTQSIVGLTGTTRHGEHGTVVGPAHDPARCTFRPDGDPSVVETFTPRIEDLTFD